MIKNLSATVISLLLLAGCSTKSTIVTPSIAPTSLVVDFENSAGDRVLFALDKSDLSEEAKLQLHKQVSWLQSHPSVKATIEGHCDERGTREYNLALGEKRADAVKRFLLHKGVESERLDTISYGKEKPAAIGNNEDAWHQNRRSVTIVK